MPMAYVIAISRNERREKPSTSVGVGPEDSRRHQEESAGRVPLPVRSSPEGPSKSGERSQPPTRG